MGVRIGGVRSYVYFLLLASSKNSIRIYVQKRPGHSLPGGQNSPSLPPTVLKETVI